MQQQHHFHLTLSCILPPTTSLPPRPTYLSTIQSSRAITTSTSLFVFSFYIRFFLSTSSFCLHRSFSMLHHPNPSPTRTHQLTTQLPHPVQHKWRYPNQATPNSQTQPHHPSFVIPSLISYTCKHD